MVGSNSGIDVNDMFDSTKKKKLVDSRIVPKPAKKRNVISKQNENIKKGHPSTQPTGTSTAKRSVATERRNKSMVPKNIKTAIAPPSSTYIPKRDSLLDTTHYAHTNDSTLMTTEPTVSNSFVDRHDTQFPEINLDLSITDIITGYSDFANVVSNQSEYLPPNPETSYQILVSQPQGESGELR